MIAIGLMSGTSLDGVDAALVRLMPRGRSYEFDVLSFDTYPYSEQDARALRNILPPSSGSTADLAYMHHRLGLLFASAAKKVAGKHEIDFVASHGQTVFHDGASRTTLQIGDPFIIRETLNASVVYDFRSADCAAGGQGAPLVPFVDAILLASDSEDRVAVNIGGIANITIIPRGAPPQSVTAFDTGPGNMLLDAFVRERTGGKQTYDVDGLLAAHGTVNEKLLEALLSDPFFALAPPRTAGREQFGLQFLIRHGELFESISLEDGAATLAAFTAAALADSIVRHAPRGARIVVSGGGADNPAIIRELRERLKEFDLERSDAMRLAVKAKEAIAFAVLGYETLRGRTANVPRATGASHPALLGSIAPHNLNELLQRIEKESV